MQGTIKNDVRRRIRIRIHTKRFDHFYCKKWEILRAAIVGILILSCGEIPLHNMPKGITFAEKQKMTIIMRRNLFVFLLLSCLTLGAVDVKAQRHRRMHEPSAVVELRLSDDKFAILYNKVKNTSFDDRKMDLIEVASLGAFYSCEQCAAIMSIFSFGDKKLAALRLMAPRIVDPHRAYIIFDRLSFQNEKDKAARIIGGCRH